MIVLTDGISFDWISFTLPFGEKSLNRALFLGDGYEVERLNYGRFGYNTGYRILDSGWIFYNNEQSHMGIHVTLSSAALGLLDYRPLQLVNLLRDWGATFKRSDFAFDDYDGLLDVGELYRKLRSGEVQTRFRKVERIEGGELGAGHTTGHTVNIGRRASEAFVRIYDKRAERLQKGVDAGELPAHWVRVELELKGKKCEAFMAMLGDSAKIGRADPAILIARLLYGLLDFKDPIKNDANKSRWPTSDFWLEFIGQVKKLKLSLPKPTKSIETAKSWVYNQVKTTLAMIVLSECDPNGNTGYDFIVKCIIDGEARMTRAQQKRLDEHNGRTKQDVMF